MKNHENKKGLVGPNGKPIGKEYDDEQENSWPVGVQALIETRINEAVGRIKENNQLDLKLLAQEHIKKWRHIAFISTTIAIISIFVAPSQISEWIKNYIQERMTEPKLQEAADLAIKQKMSEYIEDKIKPLKLESEQLYNDINSLKVEILNKQKQLESEQKSTYVQIRTLKTDADEISKNINKFSEDISQKQTQFEFDQRSLRQQLHVQQLAIAAKAGGKKEYLELNELSKVKSEAQLFANNALREVLFYYDYDRSRLSYDVLVDQVSKQDPGYSAEEICFLFSIDKDLREAAINTASKQKNKKIVQFICESIENQDDLRLIARMTLALEKLTEAKFKPLDIESVKAWWSINKNNNEYKSNYEGYFYVYNELLKGGIVKSNYEKYIKELEKTISTDNNALHARAMKGAILALSNKYIEAESEFNELEKLKSDFRWLLFWRSALFIKQNKIDDAIESMNAAFRKSPWLEEEAKRHGIFKNILKDPRIKFKQNI